MTLTKLDLEETELEAITQSICGFIKKKVKESGAEGGLVALSGGVDSAVVAALSARVIDVHGLILPEVGINDPEDVKHAVGHAEALGIDYDIIEINPIIKAVLGAKKVKQGGEGRERMAMANIKPRTRMLLNYLTANLENRLVIGTGNRTELLVGYFTKYGDGGVDMLPIGSLFKTQVWQLARYLGVPAEIVNKTPSAGLWVGQSDEAELGIKYRTADEILVRLVDLELAPEEIAGDLNIDKQTVLDLQGKVSSSSHKRSMPEITGI